MSSRRSRWLVGLAGRERGVTLEGRPGPGAPAVPIGPRLARVELAPAAQHRAAGDRRGGAVGCDVVQRGQQLEVGVRRAGVDRGTHRPGQRGALRQRWRGVGEAIAFLRGIAPRQRVAAPRADQRRVPQRVAARPGTAGQCDASVGAVELVRGPSDGVHAVLGLTPVEHLGDPARSAGTPFFPTLPTKSSESGRCGVCRVCGGKGYVPPLLLIAGRALELGRDPGEAVLALVQSSRAPVHQGVPTQGGTGRDPFNRTPHHRVHARGHRRPRDGPAGGPVPRGYSRASPSSRNGPSFASRNTARGAPRGSCPPHTRHDIFPRRSRRWPSRHVRHRHLPQAAGERAPPDDPPASPMVGSSCALLGPLLRVRRSELADPPRHRTRVRVVRPFRIAYRI